jgi:hypothetical protein
MSPELQDDGTTSQADPAPPCEPCFYWLGNAAIP